MKNLMYLVLFLMIGFWGSSQNTVGLLSYDDTRSYQGYTLIYPHNQPNVYLLDNCGEIVHTWTDEDNFRPGNTAYLLEDGRLIKTKRDKDATASNPIWAGGGGAIVEVRTWDNELLQSFELNNEDARLHHDIAVTPEGTVLMIAWEHKTKEEAIEAGRDTALLTQDQLWPEMILEWDPELDSIVWEWHVWDHLVQDFDSTKENFGVVEDNFRKININYDTSDGAADWLHANALDFNPSLNQIMISVPTFSELWVIDHSTTVEQAASSQGGISKHGGDIIYRVGNLAAYNKGTEDDQILFYQHDTHWANDFLDESDPNYGKIVCFNNRIGTDYSSVEIFESTWSMYDSDYEDFQGTFPPFEFTNTITHPDTAAFAFHSTGLSSAQFLPNGNLLTCSGRQGYIVELTPTNQIVWEYVTPRIGVNPATQGDTLQLNNNLTFRAFRYPIDYIAFDGKDLSPKGFLELEPNEEWCDRLVSVDNPEIPISRIYPNPATDMVHLTWDTGKIIDIEIVDILGRTRLKAKGNGGMKYLDISSLETNVYFIRIDGMTANKLVVAN